MLPTPGPAAGVLAILWDVNFAKPELKTFSSRLKMFRNFVNPVIYSGFESRAPSYIKTDQVFHIESYSQHGIEDEINGNVHLMAMGLRNHVLKGFRYLRDHYPLPSKIWFVNCGKIVYEITTPCSSQDLIIVDIACYFEN